MSPQSDRTGEDPKSGTLAQVGAYLGLGTEFAVTIAVCLLGGFWLDRQWGMTPLLTIVGALVGMGVAFYSLYRQVTRLQGGKEGEGPEGGDASCGSA